MPKIRYIEKKLSAKKLALVHKAVEICDEYSRQGFILTLRQLYYQFVSRGLIENTQRAYKRLGDAVNDGRLVGLIDWNYITDRTRSLSILDNWNDPDDIVKDAAGWYHRDLWRGQHNRVEVWIEKDALVGVIEGVCQENDVAFFSCRGYPSQSEIWRAAQRHIRYRRAGYAPVVIHLGDHDPSGIDMTRDIADRLHMFGVGTEVNRVALTMDQIEQYQPPPNPAKATDARFADYQALYGDESWELDALEPAMMRDLIQETVDEYKDQALFDDQITQQEEEREQLTTASDRWQDVAQFLEQ